DPGELERRLEHRPLERLALGVVVAALGRTRGLPPERAELAGLALVLGGDDAAVAEELLVLVLLLDQDPELVARLGVVVEVEVVGEQVYEERDQRGVLAGALDRRVQ